MALAEPQPPVLDPESIVVPEGPTQDDLPKEIPRPPFAQTKEQLRDLGATLSQWIYEADSAKGSLPMVWLQIARYNGDDPASYDTAPDSGEVPIHRPFISIRTDTLLSQMRGVIAAPNPLMLCESAGGDDLLSSAMERILTRQWEFGGFYDALDEVLQNAILFNLGIWRISFEMQFPEMLPEGADNIEAAPGQGVRFAGLKIDSVDPDDCIIAPIGGGVQSAQLIGERYYRRVEWLKEQEQLGIYIEGSTATLTGGSNPDQHDTLQRERASLTSASAASGEKETTGEELYELYFRKRPEEGKPEKWYKAIVAVSQAIVLDVQEWPYSRPPYFSSSVLVDKKQKRFWPGRSMGRMAIPLQDQYDKYHALLYNGNEESAQHFGTTQGSLPKAGKFDIAPNTRIVETDEAVQWDHLDFAPQAVESAIQDLEMAGDRLFCVTTNEQGASEKVNSATQSSLESQGSSTRIADLIARFELPFPQMAAYSCEVLYDMFVLWAAFDKDIKTVTDDTGFESPAPGSPTREDFKGARKWMPSGRDPHNSPMAQLAAMQSLMTMAANPETGLDVYNIMRGYLATLGLAGSRDFQKERPIAQPTQPTQANPEGTPGGPGPGAPGAPGVPGAPGEFGVARPEGIAMPAQQTEQGQMLPPLEQSSVRPQKPRGNPAHPGGGAPA